MDTNNKEIAEMKGEHHVILASLLTSAETTNSELLLQSLV